MNEIEKKVNEDDGKVFDKNSINYDDIKNKENKDIQDQNMDYNMKENNNYHEYSNPNSALI